MASRWAKTRSDAKVLGVLPWIAPRAPKNVMSAFLQMVADHRDFFLSISNLHSTKLLMIDDCISHSQTLLDFGTHLTLRNSFSAAHPIQQRLLHAIPLLANSSSPTSLRCHGSGIGRSSAA
jgi:hypothetical protein